MSSCSPITVTGNWVSLSSQLQRGGLVTAITRRGFREQVGAGRLPTSPVAPWLLVLLPRQHSTLRSWSWTLCSRISSTSEKTRQMKCRRSLKCRTKCVSEHFYQKLILYPVFDKIHMRSFAGFLVKPTYISGKVRQKFSSFIKCQLIRDREQERAFSSHVLYQRLTVRKRGSVFVEEKMRFNKRKDDKVINFCETAKVKVSIFQRHPGPKRGNSREYMNIEAEDLHRVTQRYRTPEILMRHALSFKLHIVMDSVHKTQCIATKNTFGFCYYFYGNTDVVSENTKPKTSNQACDLIKVNWF